MAAAIAVCGEPEHPIGSKAMKEPFEQTSRMPVTAPSPVALGELSCIDASTRLAAVTLNLKKDSNTSSALALLFRVSRNATLPKMPEGVTRTRLGSMGVANPAPGATKKSAKWIASTSHPLDPRLM
jgi:hypothetical protein